MKKIRIIAMCLVLCMIALCFASCSRPKTAMEYNGEVITANVYSYWLSYYKTSFVKAENDNDVYWTTKNSNGKTNEEVLLELVNVAVKHTLVCQGLFKELKLELKEGDYAEVDSALNDLVTAHGSKTLLNKKLMDYNLNYDMLKEIYLMKIRTDRVYEALYVSGGPRAIDDAKLDFYFNENYSRLDMIMIYDTFEYEVDSEGKPVFDDLTQSYKKKTLTLEESTKKNELAKEIMSKLDSGESFDTLKQAHDENLEKDRYIDGYYISSNDVNIYGAELTAVSKELNVGEYKMVDDGEVICIVMRKDLVDRAYDNKDYLDQFENLLEYCRMNDFSGYMDVLMADVKIYDDIISKYSIRDAAFITDYSLMV